jgi:hypothetical protein
MALSYKFGLLDDEGKVVRWLWFKPSYPHVVMKIKRQRRPPLDLSKVEDAPY